MSIELVLLLFERIWEPSKMDTIYHRLVSNEFKFTVESTENTDPTIPSPE